MRKQLNDVIERTMDDEMRIKLRDSYSFGRALIKRQKEDLINRHSLIRSTSIEMCFLIYNGE